MINTQFYEVLPDGRFKFRVDHHLINDHNTCDRYFMFRHIPDAEGKVWSTKGISLKIALGSWWSTVMESFYHEMQFNLPSDKTMLRFAHEAWESHKIDDFKNTDVEVYDKFGGEPGGLLMAQEYYEAFAAQHYSQWHIVGAELGFGWRDEMPLGEDDKVVVYYGGKPDLVIIEKAQNMVMPVDFKTKDSVPYNASMKFKPHPQTAGYIFAVGKLLEQLQTNDEEIKILTGPWPKAPTKCVVMICARYRPTDKPRSGVRAPRFLPVYPNYDASEIEEWRQSVMDKCRRLRDSIERGAWVPRESACHLYAGCGFRRVCSVPANVREMALQADFVKVEPWSPYTPEED